MFLTDLAGIPTLFVMAAEAEYGPALQHRLTPLMTGVGPIEAALAMGITLARLQTEGRLPKLVVSLGSAGSAKLEQAAEGHAGLRAIAASAVQHLNIALGRSGGTMANASDEQIVADHARLSEEFDANFKAGGVAVTSAKAEAAQVDPAKAGRLKAARLH